MEKIYGKRGVIISWAAERKWVRWLWSAIAEADRHNIRGEHISTWIPIPLVGRKSRSPMPCGKPQPACLGSRRWCSPDP